MIDTFDRIEYFFMDLVGEKGSFIFGQKSAIPATLQRTARGGAQRGERRRRQAAEATSVVYRRSSLLSKQASTSSLYYYGFQNFPPLLLWLGRKVPFTLKLGSLQ